MSAVPQACRPVNCAVGPLEGPDVPLEDVAEELEVALADLAALAVAVVPGCVGAGVTLGHGGSVSTVAATGQQVRQVDGAQYQRGDGPCLRALTSGSVVTCEDFGGERRWPDVAQEALAVGVRSSLSLPLRDGVQVVGALNLYGSTAHAFDSAARLAADVLARQNSLMLRHLALLCRERRERLAEHRIAETLQRSLLPALPQLPGLACAARYLVSADSGQVGGDWYDLFALPDGGGAGDR